MISSDYFIKGTANIREAWKKLNDNPSIDTLFVRDENDNILGSITDGDIRRYLIKTNDLEANLTLICNKNFKHLKQGYTTKELKRLKDQGIKIIPLLEGNDTIDIIDLVKFKSHLPIEAVLMAGGKGTRLKPLTDNCPKPLLEIGDKPIIERNLDRLRSFGINKFHITINYLGDLIINHFENLPNRSNYSIDFVNEAFPMGTAGSLSLINEISSETFLLSNSDLLTDLDYEAFYEFHQSNNCDITIVSAPYNVNIPFAVLESENSRIHKINEKPTLRYNTNAGIYLIRKSLLKLIPNNRKYDITDLIDYLLKENYKVYQFEHEGYWLDIGRIEDFEKAKSDYNKVFL